MGCPLSRHRRCIHRSYSTSEAASRRPPVYGVQVGGKMRCSSSYNVLVLNTVLERREKEGDVEIIQGDRAMTFPQWKQEMFQQCLCRTCSFDTQDPQSNFEGALVMANLLALNALDLTAPASDALLKNRKNSWVQLAGHPGSFAPAGPHTIWKKRMLKENHETMAYKELMEDEVKPLIPQFYREVEYNGDIFIEIEDLLQHFHDPNIMDIKMGTRTFLECEVKNPVLRKDLYEKMVMLDGDEPSEEEHEQKAITKLRYMQFREKSSCTSTLGFRPEALRFREKSSCTSTLGFRPEALRISGQQPNKELKKVKTRAEVKSTISSFLSHHPIIIPKLLHRLNEMRDKFDSSHFFKSHEIIGSSLLFLYDAHGHANIWMIDFAKTLLVEGVTLNHHDQWLLGNHEDGYLHGLDNLIQVFEELETEHLPPIDNPSIQQVSLSHTQQT